MSNSLSHFDANKQPFYLGLVVRMFSLSLFLFFAVRLVMLVLYPAYFADTAGADIAMAIIYGVRFDLSLIVMLGAVSFLWLILPIASLQKPVIRQFFAWLYGVTLALAASLYLGDVYYFGEVERHLGRELFNIGVHDIGGVVNMALTAAPIFTAFGLIAVALFLVLWWRFVIVSCRSTVRVPKSIMAKAGTFLLALVLLVFLGRGMLLHGRPMGVIEAFEMPSLQTANLSLNGTFVVIKQFSRPKDQPLHLLERDDYQRLDQQYRSKNEFVRPDLTRQSEWMVQGQLGWQKDWFKQGNQRPSVLSGKPKNVVILLLESWSARYIDALSHNNYQATPFLDRLIEQSWAFDRMYAAGQRSIFGLQSSLSSIPILHNYPSLGFGLETNRLSKMGEAATEQGYATFFAQTSPRRSFHVDGIARLVGFEHYFGKEDVDVIKQYPEGSNPPFGWDYDSLIHFTHTLSEHAEAHPEQPFISMLFTGTTHLTYADPGEAYHIRPHDPKGENGFLNTLRYSDWSIEQFMTEAAKTDWYQDTVFIFLADHTNSAVGAKNLDDQFRIPLVMFAPDGSLPAKRSQTIVSQYDILPTVLDLIQSPQTIATFGRSVFDDVRLPYALVAKGSVYGAINEQGWAEFSGVKNLDTHLKAGADQAAIERSREHARWRLQYVDQLLRKNQWLPADVP